MGANDGSRNKPKKHMIINKSKLSLVASTDAGRPAIQHVYVDGDFAVATNGKAMAIVPVIKEEGDKAQAIVPIDVVKSAEKFGNKARQAQITLNGEAKASDGNGKSVALPYPELNYPNYKQVIPEESAVTVALDAKLLWELAQALGAEGWSRSKPNGQFIVKLHIKDDLSAVRVTTEANRSALGIIMPCVLS